MSVTKLHHFLANPGRVRLMSNSKDLDVTALSAICEVLAFRTLSDLITIGSLPEHDNRLGRMRTVQLSHHAANSNDCGCR